MRLFGRILKWHADHPCKNELHSKCRNIWLIPLIVFDLVKTIVKTKGDVDSDAVWDEITTALFLNWKLDEVHAIYDLERSYREEVLGLSE